MLLRIAIRELSGITDLIVDAASTYSVAWVIIIKLR